MENIFGKLNKLNQAYATILHVIIMLCSYYIISYG